MSQGRRARRSPPSCAAAPPARRTLPEIWTLGHRNVPGLARDPETGEVWSHEHGSRGGDEINLMRAGANYGWPLVTHGIDYDGSIISERAFGPGFERAAFLWAPSIAPSGLAVYRGEAFADWHGHLLVGGLVSKSVVRLRRGRETALSVEEERMFGDLGKRIRDVRVAPDGLVYLLTDEDEAGHLRLRPRWGTGRTPARRGAIRPLSPRGDAAPRYGRARPPLAASEAPPAFPRRGVCCARRASALRAQPGSSMRATSRAAPSAVRAM
jgi:hypothetical protein